MSIKLYLQIVICAMIVHSANAGITMSRSKTFEFLYDSSPAKTAFAKRYGFTHYLVTKIGQQNNLPQHVIDSIVGYLKYIPKKKKPIQYISEYELQHTPYNLSYYFESPHNIMFLCLEHRKWAFSSFWVGDSHSFDWDLFKKFENNDYTIEKCNLIEKLLDQRKKAKKEGFIFIGTWKLIELLRNE
jgi:hypothetical protein